MWINFRYPGSEKRIQVKMGVAWALLFLSGLFGIPLFYRKFYKMASAVLFLEISAIICLFFFVSGMEYYENYILYENLYGGGPHGSFGSLSVMAAGVYTILSYVAVTYIAIAASVLGNKWTARAYLKKGWKIDENDPLYIKGIKMAWSAIGEDFLNPAPATAAADVTKALL